MSTASPFRHQPAHYRSRYREIVTVLARHGLGWLVLALGLDNLVPFERGLLGHPPREEPYTQAEHLRMALADLGPSFIKLGQVLSTRADMLPPEYIAELSKLQDAAPPVPYAGVAAVIERALGAPPEAVFAAFAQEPRASASLGQAHAARLKDGTRVIVKVQRPGVVEVVERDLAVLADLAHLAATRTRLGRFYDLADWVEEFGFTLRNELDYTREGQNADRFRRNFAAEPALHIPKIYWQYTTPQVLTMEQLRGIKINDLAALEAAGLDRRRIAENSVRIMLTEVFEHGFFHADPHPGNFFVLPGEVIGLMDYGMVGHMDETLKDSLLRLAMALVRQDTERVVDELVEVSVASGHVQRQSLKRDLDHLVARYYDRPIAEWAAGQTLQEVMGIAFRHRLQLPTDLTLLAKVLIMSEGLGAQLDPDFKLLAFAQPYLHRFWLQGRAPSHLAGKITQGLADLADLGLKLPERTRRLLNQVERGDLTLTTRHEGLDEALHELNRVANRLAMSVLTAALIIALGLAMLVYHPQGWAAWAGWFFTTLFVLAAALGIGLLWSVWRSR